MLIPKFLIPGSDDPFPDVQLALREPDGLLAMGGDLSVQRLMAAYRHGIFPWYSEDQPILWWSPNPRLVLYPENLHIATSLAKLIRKHPFVITMDQAFAEVIQACAQPRPDQDGTWITPEMQNAYCQLHELGAAHSVEAWQDNQLVGGLYGVALGQVFFGESMFSRQSNASKVAFAHLVKQLRDWNFKLVDCQVRTAHLISLGATEISRADFVQQLNAWCDQPNAWTKTREINW